MVSFVSGALSNDLDAISNQAISPTRRLTDHRHGIPTDFETVRRALPAWTFAIQKNKESPMDESEMVGMYELIDSLEAVIRAADPAKREILADTIDAYAEGPFAEEYFWAVGAQSPSMLNHLVNAIDSACRPESQSKPRAAIRLVDRKPEGSA
jgi:hypothetical protein